MEGGYVQEFMISLEVINFLTIWHIILQPNDHGEIANFNLTYVAIVKLNHQWSFEIIISIVRVTVPMVTESVIVV